MPFGGGDEGGDTRGRLWAWCARAHDSPDDSLLWESGVGARQAEIRLQGCAPPSASILGTRLWARIWAGEGVASGCVLVCEAARKAPRGPLSYHSRNHRFRWYGLWRNKAMAQ
eukprot:8214-Prymnesium_polylepis.1